MYFTRGYAFHAYEYGKRRATGNYGVRVKGESDFYGILQEIIEVEFIGLVQMKCVLFKCDWFDPIVGTGVRYNKFGVVDVNAGRRYNKFEPFILASQAEQVSFIPYPRVRTSRITWFSAITVMPRGRIIGEEAPPLQQDSAIDIPTPDESTNNFLLIDPDEAEFDDLPYDTEIENENDEFQEREDQSDDSNEASDNEAVEM